MSKPQRKKITKPITIDAIVMRYILSILLFLLLAGMTGGFYFAYTMLHNSATEASNKQAELGSIDSRVHALEILKKDLAKYKQSADRAANIVASAKSYQYQNQVIDDLKFYASTANVSLYSFSFKDDDTKLPTKKPTNADAALKSTQVSIQLGKNVEYINLLHFLHLIEKSLTRMQITDISLSRGDNSNGISVQTLTLEVYIK